MAELFDNVEGNAFGGPGIEPRWTRSDKSAIVTAYSTSSPVWATLSAGIVNEVYFPTIDRPQIRDLQFLISDGETFFHDERCDTETMIERLCGDSLLFQITNTDRGGRYKITKQVVTAPHAACLIMQCKFEVQPEWKDKLKLYALIAPHLAVGGKHNNGSVEINAGRMVLSANRDDNWLLLDCSCGFSDGSCGYVGSSDGWTDLSKNKKLDWHFATANDGNIALIGEINYSHESEFRLALGFGTNRHNALSAVAETLAIPFEEHVEKYREQWKRACVHRVDELAKHSGDEGQLYRISHNALLAHEDKTCHGAMIASLSIPWGEAKSDKDLGGYHLVWPRDLVNSATGLLAAGELATPLRALIYLATSQLKDGGFYQNFWINGKPYWSGVQLDEVAFPILLAWKLHELEALELFDPYPMVKAAAGYLIHNGPATPQERWEENSGYSPSTLAAHISALVCASDFAKDREELDLSSYFIQYADFLQQHLFCWCVTQHGTLMPDIPTHFVRILPIDVSDPHASEDVESAAVHIQNLADDAQQDFPAKEIVDAGFLELVRYGIMKADDPLIIDSLKVIDQELRVETPGGPCWRRYNHDGYGQRADGGPFTGVGQGRAWPLLSGERAHYEIAAGNDPMELIHAMESFSGPMGLLPEQIWDAPDMPQQRMELGRPTGSAMPLMWAHAEYIKLLRSMYDRKVYDRIYSVAARYCDGKQKQQRFEIWTFKRQIKNMKAGDTLRIQTDAAFKLRWSADQWKSTIEVESQSPGLSINYVDLPAEIIAAKDVQFAFCWESSGQWEDQKFSVAVKN